MGEAKLWGFMSDTGLSIAKGSSHLWSDGNFEIMKKTLFNQLW